MPLANFTLLQLSFRPYLSHYARNGPSFYVSSSFNNIVAWNTFSGFYLNDLFGLDYPSKKKRFQILSLFSSLTSTPEKYFLDRRTSYSCLSLNPFYSSSIFLERETFDLFGIFFEGNIDMRRILTDYGFSSFPLRKDFPLTGYFELNFSPSRKTLYRWKISFAQHLRHTGI